MKFFEDRQLKVTYRAFAAKLADGHKVARCKFRLARVTSRDIGMPGGLKTSVKQFEENQFDSEKKLALEVEKRNLVFLNAPDVRSGQRFENVTLQDFALSRAEDGGINLDFQADLPADLSSHAWFWETLGNELWLTISQAQPELPGMEGEEKPVSKSQEKRVRASKKAG